MVELYLDNLEDLLWKAERSTGGGGGGGGSGGGGGGGEAPRLEIKKDEAGLVFVRGAVLKPCLTAAATLELFEAGNAARHTSATNMNATSSRSHLVFALVIKAHNTQTRRTAMGKISLNDLAGSERVGKTGATADRLREATSINRSLSALGNVISALSTGAAFVP